MPPSERVRVYLPLTAAMLRRAREDGGFGPVPLPAHAVTPALETELGGADQEECEYAALTAAAVESLTLLRPGDAARRVVAAVDVPAWEPRTEPADQEPSAVTVATSVPLRRLAAVHVDGAEAAADVAAARDLLRDPSSAGSQEAADAVRRCLDHELGWFAAQELGDLLDALSDDSPPGRGTID